MRPSGQDKEASAAAGFDFRLAVVRLEKHEQMRSGVNRAEARKRVAYRAGIAPGTLERIVRNRVKDFRTKVRQRVCDLVVREWEAEIRALERQVAAARRYGDLGETALADIEAGLMAARERLSAYRQQ